jgi:hypothetical protein
MSALVLGPGIRRILRVDYSEVNVACKSRQSARIEILVVRAEALALRFNASPDPTEKTKA